MVKHVVMWRLRQFESDTERAKTIAAIKAGLAGLVGMVPGLLSAQVGENFNPAGLDLCLYSEFLSVAALEEYQTHPAHMAVKKIVHAAITERAVCDWSES